MYNVFYSYCVPCIYFLAIIYFDHFSTCIYFCNLFIFCIFCMMLNLYYFLYLLLYIGYLTIINEFRKERKPISSFHKSVTIETIQSKVCVVVAFLREQMHQSILQHVIILLKISMTVILIVILIVLACNKVDIQEWFVFCILTLTLLELKVISHCHQYRAAEPDHQLQLLILISLKMIMDSFKKL